MKDVGFALRSLWKAKPFAIATFLTLSLCIGANTVLFVFVNGVLLKPLAVPQPDRLVFVVNGYRKAGLPRAGTGVPDHFDRVSGMKSVESLALYSYRSSTTGDVGRPERVGVMSVTPSYFRVARVEPFIGRTFLEREGEPDSNARAILSYSYWRDRFRANPNVLGEVIRIDDRPYTIVGVMPRTFQVVEPAESRLWIPLAFTSAQKSDQNRHNNSYNSIGRLREGATVTQAQGEVDRLNEAARFRLREWRTMMETSGFGTVVLPLQQDLVRNVRASLQFLWGSTLLVLLIGCANVVNLALVRSHGRTRDLVTRMALGAGRLAIVRHVFTECLLLTTASGLMGLTVGWASLRVIGRFDLRQIPRAQSLGIDTGTVCFTVGLSITVAALMALFTLGAVRGVNLASVLHEGGRGASSGRARLLRRSLVVVQVAIAFMLLVGSGLLISSFRRVASISPGFDSTHVLTANVSLPVRRYVVQTSDPNVQDRSRLDRFAEVTVEQLRAMPGVVNAGITSSIPLSGGTSTNSVMAEGRPPKPGEPPMTAMRVHVTPGYMETLRIPLLRGRYFDKRDRADAPQVVIVDSRLAERLWPGQDPVGRRMYQGSVDQPDPRGWQTVVGVVGEVKQIGLVADRPVGGVYYYPMGQNPAIGLTFVVRTAGEPGGMTAALRQTIAATDPELPVYRVRTYEEVISDSLLMRRWPMLVTTAFAIVALLLAAIGLYGVLAYVVSQRSRELAIRMALGGAPARVMRLVAREGFALVAVGLLGGGLGVALLQRAVTSLLYGVEPGDPRVLTLAGLLLGVMAAGACAIPAWRVTQVDPVRELNRE